MTTKDLRIGNYVTDQFYGSFKKVITVESINQRGINLEPADDGKPYGMHSPTIDVEYEFKHLDGIPLTEEWLIKFGFEKVDVSPFETIKLRYWAKDALLLFFNEPPSQPENTYLVGYGSHIMGVYSVNKSRWIDSVHTLQNVYFGFLGKDLTLKP
jgi:hypothetical protein